MGLLYKVKKIKLERRMIDRETKIYGPYLPTIVKTDYRSNKNAVTLARKAADSANHNADRYDQAHPSHEHGYPARHTVEVEVCEEPSFIEYGKVEGKTTQETEQNIAAWRSGSASP